MLKQKLDESVVNIISDNSNCISKADAFVGDKVYNISIYMDSADKKAGCYYVAASEGDVLLSISSVREDLDVKSAERMNFDLIKRLETALDGVAEISAVVNDAEDADETKQPVMVKIKTDIDLKNDEKTIKIIRSDITDWLEELTVMHTAKVSEKQAADFKQEYDKIMSANVMPHDEAKDYSFTMAIFAMAFALISIFYHEMALFPVITMITALFSGYRAYSNKNYKALVLCIISMIVGIVFGYIGWKNFSISMKR